MRTEDLFAAARADAPSPEQQAENWRHVAAATGIAAGSSVAVTAATSAKASLFAKLLAVGGAIGAVGTALGVVVASAITVPDPPGASMARPEGAHVARRPSSGVRMATVTPRRLDPAFASRARVVNERTELPTARSLAPPTDRDELEAEAGLITSARAALLAGDAARALALAGMTRHLSTRALEPEAMSLEARALRALGRTDEAAAVELGLRMRFPEHALSR